ncbi:MAG: hypothetical protein IPN16_00250 [Gemmatimonadetes bacterium]|nr:hypothetical protein [Gemmatimonadota bacterium]
MTNRGFEASLLTTLVDTRPLRLDLSVTGSTNRNRLVTLGAGVDTIFFGLGALDGNFRAARASYWVRIIRAAVPGNSAFAAAEPRFSIRRRSPSSAGVMNYRGGHPTRERFRAPSSCAEARRVCCRRGWR